EAGFESNITKRYKMVQKKLCELNTLQFAVTVNILPPLKYYMLLKERCERCNDNAACIVFEERIKGDPEADDEVSRLGLLGLWEIEDNWHAGELLVALDVITEEEFKRTIAEKEGVEAAPPAPPGIPAGFEDAIKGMKAEGKEWPDILAYIDTKFGQDGLLISAAAAIFYQTPSAVTPPPEPTAQVEAPVAPPVEVPTVIPVEAPQVKPAAPPVPETTNLKKAIEERMEKLKRENQAGGESSLVIKEEILIPPSYQTLVYMQPSDYEECRFLDFEGIIPGLKFEDLQQLSSHVGLSERMTGQEKDTIRELISKRMNEIRLGGL
ncbi:MAG: hypothetical protein KAR54_03855, partial [Candidatus Pacebacteria bacterium]|nr:hypothetical protein [Candidatus Paceibacterota bacterium]